MLINEVKKMENNRLSVRGLNPEIVIRFREYVRTKYGKLHTVFGLEVEKALSEHLEGYKKKRTTHTHTQKKIPKGFDKIEKIAKKLNETKEEQGYITSENMRNVIGMYAGIDERTYRKYREALFNFGFIQKKY